MARIKRLFLVLAYVFTLVAARCFVILFGRGLLKKNIWLIREKGVEARDNAYHLFKYLRENHKEISFV